MYFALMAALCSQLVEDKFIATVRQTATKGYLLAYILVENEAVRVAGFKVATSLFMGKNLQVTDFISSEVFRS